MGLTIRADEIPVYTGKGKEGEHIFTRFNEGFTINVRNIGHFGTGDYEKL
jgi:hypothetical protein